MTIPPCGGLHCEPRIKSHRNSRDRRKIPSEFPGLLDVSASIGSKYGYTTYKDTADHSYFKCGGNDVKYDRR